ncbi:auxin transporter [Raphidocelis subcapitata]|uniref:Auxin transporter n=1 Tax=Raphidocelis subcapitata TaxID=307507 RepID=A0A2V0P671_9CHLO|nr:auxin transporter [Raphidocelis subcapitata]|eukprot:GBF93363.1 auxin transporter [Raphidocelis subcapitata]
MLMEVVDSQWRPSRFPPTFGAAIGYVTAALTLPSAVFTFLAFPQQATQFGNAFAIFPPSAAKNAGIILMVAHQIVAFALFALPVCVMWEKLVGTHSKPKPLRLLSRIPVGLLIWFIALAIPFFGVINDVLGAFCVTFETYVIPATAWCLYYRKKENRDAAVLQPPRWLGGWTGAFVLNAAVILIFLVAGLGAGGYSSIVALVEAVGTFGLFAKCYNC